MCKGAREGRREGGRAGRGRVLRGGWGVNAEFARIRSKRIISLLQICHPVPWQRR